MSVNKTATADLDTIKQLAESQNKIAEVLEKLSTNDPARKSPFNAPHIRKGEDPNSSRGYSFVRVAQAFAKLRSWDDCKTEVDIHNKLQKRLVDEMGMEKSEKNSFFVPVSADLMNSLTDNDVALSNHIREVVNAGVAGYSQGEYKNWANYVRKTLSWTDETALGSFVSPPVQGEMIDLLRNNETFLKAGATMLAMPPNGRIVYPKHTGPSSAYWVGESQQITASEPTSGDVTLQAKKLAALVKIPNELFRFASVNLEMFLRDDVAKVLALKMDSAFLQGVGSSNAPKGIINYPNINFHTASKTGAAGDTFQPEDVALMIGKTEEANAVFNGFVMRPLMYTALVNRRSDAATPGDKAGPFVFQYLRGLDQRFPLDRDTPANLYGYNAWKSTNVSNTRTKGSASNLTYILGGDFSDYIVGMASVLEFAVSTQGDTPFQNDQTWLRGILLCDGAPRHEASFTLCDQLVIG